MGKFPDGHRYIKKCKQCDASFRTFPSAEKKGGGKFCSKICGIQWRTTMVSKRNSRECFNCHNIFVAKPVNIRKGSAKYCSRLCQNKFQGAQQRGVKKNFPESWYIKNKEKAKARIGKPSPIRGKKFPHLSKENHWNWKGGVSSERDKAMSSFAYKEWRTKVFARDNYTCQICEEYGGTLHADHIKKWSDYEELRYTVDNGRTLCVPCHYYITFKRKMKPGQRWCNFTAKKEG